ncbi:SLOG family protein [Sphingobium lignivorans]|uniref:Phage-like protein YoqJ n=1 Tax=Sphingobium lignivorans TaxID=2735886 RepID=A0ABR6NG13_9SPHN|nr:SLOG family protein [Sphingobium lignivorans]MBB5986016.1 putative phage-like protein YoqJ [Sphingobium lignivorans]
MTILAVTGHRPDKLGGYGPEAKEKLCNFAETVLAELCPRKVITGMALGWDQAVAKACILFDIPFVAALPFPDHGSNWPEEARRIHGFLLDHAVETIVVCRTYSTTAMQLRNMEMVDRADEVRSLWDGSSGGTGNCVRYAKRRKKFAGNHWNAWTQL